MVPQETDSVLPRPRKLSPASAPIAPVAAPKKPTATREVICGRISRTMIVGVRSPANFAAVTKSRLRRVMIRARLERAAPAQLMMPTMRMVNQTLRTSE